MTDPLADELEFGERLDAIEEGYQLAAARNLGRINHLGKRTTGLLAFLAVVQLVLGGWSLTLTRQNGDRSRETRAALMEIQSSRIQITAETCLAQNVRHRDLTVYIRALAAHPQPGQRRVPKTGQRRRAAGFVDAIAPHQDCPALLFKRFGVRAPPAANSGRG